ncbi:MAG: two-component system KDP operon response regulator KdpE [Myxococcota bacterium]|jgi:two-component system KDP operon response regulator KdpE
MSERPDTTVTTGELLTEVWGVRASTRTRAVSHAIQRLRRKLEQDSGQPRHLLTDHGDG